MEEDLKKLNISATIDRNFLKFKTQEIKQKKEKIKRKMTSNWRRPQKVEYLSNHWPNLPQIGNLRAGDQTKIKKTLKGRRPPMEEDLKKLNISATNGQIILKF